MLHASCLATLCNQIPLLQVAEADADFDSLEELYSQCCSLMHESTQPYQYYVKVQTLLQENASVEQFQHQLQLLLLPDMLYVHQGT